MYRVGPRLANVQMIVWLVPVVSYMAGGSQILDKNLSMAHHARKSEEKRGVCPKIGTDATVETRRKE